MGRPSRKMAAAERRRPVEVCAHDPDRQTLETLQRLFADGTFGEVEHRARQLLTQYPRSPAVHHALGAALEKREAWDEAGKHHEEAVRLGGEHPAFLTGLAAAQAGLEKTADEEQSLERVLALDPDHWQALIRLAVLRRGQGRPDEALELLDRVLARDAGHPIALYERTALMTVTPGDPMIERLQKGFEDRVRDVEARARAGFALGKARLDLGDDEAAFDAYRRANALLHPVRRPSPDPLQALQALREVHDRNYFAGRRDHGIDDASQVLILGASRSGKSLVESLLGCHPDVETGGESQRLAWAVHDIVGDDYRRYVGTVDAGRSRADARACLEKIRGRDDRSPDTRTVAPVSRLRTNTLPDDLWRLGLVGLWFPRTPIVFCMRDLPDHGLSVYFRYYTRGNRQYFDLGEIGEYIRGYEALMTFFRECLPNPIHVVRYEDLVDDPVGHARALYAHAGLGFDPACLETMERNRAWAAHLTTEHSLDLPVPIRNDLKGIAGRFRDRLGPLEEGYRKGDDRIAAVISPATVPAVDAAARETGLQGITDNPAAIVQMAEQLLDIGRVADAGDLVLLFLKPHFDRADVRHLCGRINLATGLYDEAIDWLRQAVEAAPADPRYRESLAVAAERAGQRPAIVVASGERSTA